jgi:nitrogen fixation/metabolism regulation signal transduction histidine kinase
MALVFLAFMAPLVMAAAILGVSMADAFARPIAAIERATQRVAEGDMGARVLASPADDFAHLSLGFNRMLAEIDRFRAVLLQEEKENAWQTTPGSWPMR